MFSTVFPIVWYPGGPKSVLSGDPLYKQLLTDNCNLSPKSQFVLHALVRSLKPNLYLCADLSAN